MEEEREKGGVLLLRMPRSLKDELMKLARREGVSLNQLCVFVLSREVGKREGGEGRTA
jgi:predicted HicB family RNase H-like nuclease